MKILYITSSFDPHTALWVKYFAKKHNVYLFSDKKETRNKLIYPKNIKIIESEGHFGPVLNKLSVKKQQLRHIDMLLSVKKFVKEIKDIIINHEIDIVHAHSLYYGFLASFLNNEIPVIFTPMGSDIILYAQTSKIHNYMAKKAFKRANVITGDSKILQSQGIKIGAREHNNYIIQNGVDTDLFFPTKSEIREQLNISEETLLLYSPRAIATLYNIDDIIKSLDILKRKHIDFKCMFTFSFGNEHFEYLKNLVDELHLNDYVIWLGYIDYNDMAKYYNVADIVISVPSSDSSPKSVYEAMFCGKPVIVSDLPWSHEFLTDGENIILTPVNNVNMLADKIITLANNPALIKTISNNALKKAEELYSYEQNMTQMEAIMKDLIRTLKD